MLLYWGEIRAMICLSYIFNHRLGLDWNERDVFRRRKETSRAIGVLRVIGERYIENIKKVVFSVLNKAFDEMGWIRLITTWKKYRVELMKIMLTKKLRNYLDMVVTRSLMFVGGGICLTQLLRSLKLLAYITNNSKWPSRTSISVFLIMDKILR